MTFRQVELALEAYEAGGVVEFSQRVTRTQGDKSLLGLPSQRRHEGRNWMKGMSLCTV